MQAIKCELCGSNQLIKKDGYYQCEYCGTKYTLEEARKLIVSGTVSIDGDVKIKEADFIIRAGTLEKYNGASTDVVIPNTVTRIGQYAFSGCKGLKSIKIPNSITTIECNAFENCTSLTDIEIPNSVTHIGQYSFSGCKGLKSIKIPNSVTTIECNAFENCTSLTSIEIPNSVATIGYSAFEGCKKLSNVKIPQGCQVGNGALTDTLFEQNKRKQQKLCQHCGGTFMGIFNKVCSKCGKPKDY